MGNFFIVLINGLIKSLGLVLNALALVLPPSPFNIVAKNAVIEEFLGYVNYIIPIAEIISIGEVWLVSVGVYYVYSTVLRWLKAIE